MEEKCASAAICFVAFLPDILDTKAEGRNRYLEQLLSVAEKFRRSPYRQVSKNTHHITNTSFQVKFFAPGYHIVFFTLMVYTILEETLNESTNRN